MRHLGLLVPLPIGFCGRNKHPRAQVLSWEDSSEAVVVSCSVTVIPTSTSLGAADPRDGWQQCRLQELHLQDAAIPRSRMRAVQSPAGDGSVCADL